MRGKIIVCGSQKGGVGKTVTTFNLAYALTSLGKKVLAVDFDSQGNLSTCMGIEDLRNEEKTIGHLMMAEIDDEPIEAVDDFIQKNAGIDFISALSLSCGHEASVGNGGRENA